MSMLPPKYVVNQIVQVPTTSPNNTTKATVVVAGQAAAQNVYLVHTGIVQTLVIESQLISHT
jgi:hypothetical protein